jgi:hypothetical protein
VHGTRATARLLSQERQRTTQSPSYGGVELFD